MTRIIAGLFTSVDGVAFPLPLASATQLANGTVHVVHTPATR